jgi:hypothetical protein
VFKKDVREWVLELRKKARATNHVRKTSPETREFRDERRHAKFMEANEKYHALTLEFDKELERTPVMFAPYLDFSENL